VLFRSEYYHFTVGVGWRWNIITLLWMCGGAGMSLHCGCVVPLHRVPSIALTRTLLLSENEERLENVCTNSNIVLKCARQRMVQTQNLHAIWDFFSL
jgi:hypothetical protein